MSRKLICSLLMVMYCGGSEGAAVQINTTQKNKENEVAQAEGIIKNIFATPKDQQTEGNRIQPQVKERVIVDTDQLQKMVDGFPESDKKVLNAIKVQIATWPQDLFNEISAYREFVIDARKVAQQKYLALSAEARAALESEKKLKEKLSPETVSALGAVNVSASN